MNSKPAKKDQLEVSSDQLKTELIENKERLGALETIASISNKTVVEAFVKEPRDNQGQADYEGVRSSSDAGEAYCAIPLCECAGARLSPYPFTYALVIGPKYPVAWIPTDAWYSTRALYVRKPKTFVMP